MTKISDRVSALCCSESGTVRDGMVAINNGTFGFAIVLNASGKFVRLLTDGDLRRALLAGSSLETPLQELSLPPSRTSSATEPKEAIVQMFNNTVHVLPILDNQGDIIDVALFDKRLHIPIAEPTFDTREILNLIECVVSGWVSSAGKFISDFERSFATFCEADHAVAICNGTAALHLALLAVGVGPGDEVIVPTSSFIATANAVTYTGATPVFVDVDPHTWTIDPEAVKKAVTPRTKAIVPVHLFGHPADMDPLMEIAREHGLKVVEDAAEAHGARYKGRRVGAIGDIGIFSFYGNKIITTGEGGMVVTNDPALVATVTLLRDHGMSPERRYWHPVVGYNYRMTNLQAAVGVAQMEKIEDILSTKRVVAKCYDQALANMPGVTLPVEAEWAENVYWMYTVVLDEGVLGMTRDMLMARLKDRRIDSRPFFPAMHRQPIYEQGVTLPVAEHLSRFGLCLPSMAGLTEDGRQEILSAIMEAFSKDNTSAETPCELFGN